MGGLQANVLLLSYAPTPSLLGRCSSTEPHPEPPVQNDIQVFSEVAKEKEGRWKLDSQDWVGNAPLK